MSEVHFFPSQNLDYICEYTLRGGNASVQPKVIQTVIASSEEKKMCHFPSLECIGHTSNTLRGGRGGKCIKEADLCTHKLT